MKKPVLSERDLEVVREFYRDGISRFGVTFDSLCAGSEEKTEVRSKVHASAILKDESSVLDVGCGIGYFCGFLKRHGYSIDYTGYDIMPEYIEQCVRTYPDGRFLLRNILEEGFDQTYDTIVMSQVFNNRYKESDNVAVMKEAISLAFDRSTVSVSIDMATKYVDYETEVIYRYSPEEIFSFAKSLTKRVILRHDYRRFEFAVQLIHDSYGDFVP